MILEAVLNALAGIFAEISANKMTEIIMTVLFVLAVAVIFVRALPFSLGPVLTPRMPFLVIGVS